MSSPAPKAKTFLINRILDQAKREGVSLDPVETTMLGFSEATAGSKQMEAASIFERDYDDQQYEEKIAGLIRHAFDTDTTNGGREAWDAALVGLGDVDVYLVVMLKKAGVWSSGQAWLDWRLFWAFWPIALCVVVGVVMAFTSLGARLVPNQYLRLVILLICLFAPFAINRVGANKNL